MTTVIHPLILQNQISQIISPKSTRKGGLYLGNYLAVKSKQILSQYGINAILTVARELQLQYPSKCAKLWIKVDDNPLNNLLEHFPACIKFIQDHISQTNVLVHCRAGVSRSATIVIAYLMHSKKYSLKKAYIKCKQKRVIINPNVGFMMQLQIYQQTKKQQIGVENIQLLANYKPKKSNNNLQIIKTKSLMKINKEIQKSKSTTLQKYILNKPKQQNKKNQKLNK